MVPKIIWIVVLTIFSAIFSASETAFSLVSKSRLKTLAETGKRKASVAFALSEKEEKLTTTVQILNVMVNVIAATIGVVLFLEINDKFGAVISAAAITFAVLVFGELTPKAVAKNRPEKVAVFLSPLINLLFILFTPVAFLLNLFPSLISKAFGPEEEEKMSQEELIMLVEEVTEEGNIDTEESELLRNAIEFNGIEVEDILTHRVDLTAVSIDQSKDEIAKVFSESKFSRLLVYEESIDNIVGVLHLKNFYLNSGLNPAPLKDIITPPIFIMQTEKLDDILNKLQANKSHIAVVLDEYGGTYGIVTMEDILEELVGDIWDEHDEVDIDFKEIGENTYCVSGQMDMEDFCEFFEMEKDEETTSVGGWVAKMLEKIPEAEDKFEFENLQISVLSVESHRVLEIVVVRIPKETEEEEE